MKIVEFLEFNFTFYTLIAYGFTNNILLRIDVLSYTDREKDIKYFLAGNSLNFKSI